MSLNYYAHTISEYNMFIYKEDMSKLEKILKCGYLLSRRKLGLEQVTSGFNGMDYISLCDLTKKHEDYSAFKIYTERGLSLLFDKSIKVLDPLYYKNDNNRKGILFFEDMHRLGLGEARYSDLKDEVQVKDELSLKYLKGLLLSYRMILHKTCESYCLAYIDKVYELLNNYNYNVPIINLDDEEVLIKKR